MVGLLGAEIVTRCNVARFNDGLNVVETLHVTSLRGFLLHFENTNVTEIIVWLIMLRRCVYPIYI
ncbi:hypothetical protein CAL7102_01459 [Dulcicalothrix desertica PCC 7102]|nr:hypothetical protein CAL7102_01459 [Dulcicalothrix desertica PCC 7102]